MVGWGENIEELRQSVRAGSVVRALTIAGAAVYFLLTLDRPHRTELLLVDAGMALLAFTVPFAPLEALVRRRLVVPFFLIWNVGIIVLLSTAVAIDDDPASPLVMGFVLPIVFAAMAFPLRLVLMVSLIDLVAMVGTLAIALDRDPADIWMYAVIAAGVAALCIAQARSHERHLADVARISRTDHLTEALNRRGFEEELAARLARFRRYGTPVGIVLLDLDDFKAINDDLGHAAGDVTLQAVAETLRHTVRVTDAVSRVGGDEFAVLLEQSDGLSAPMVAERILDAIRLHTAASAGWATCPDDADEGDVLYRIADERLYQRKSQRRARTDTAGRVRGSRAP